MSLDAAAASRFATLALAGIEREYPHKPDHVLDGPSDFQTHRQLHPAFYGSFDWHSAVHGHWTLVRLLRRYRNLPEPDAIRAALDRNLSASNLIAEAGYFDRPERRTFERPYGWAWLLKLAEELHDWEDADGGRWSATLAPLARRVVANYTEFLPRLEFPNRVGTHANTAFGLSFAWDYAAATSNRELEALATKRARDFFGSDRNYPVRWEPGGEDFFSPTLTEADLMARVLSAEEFASWFDGFLPRFGRGEPCPFVPVTVRDRSDGRLVHLDGLNLSRAWGMRRIAAALPSGHPATADLIASAGRHAHAGRAHVESGNYAGEHWLGTFAVYLET